MVTIASFFLYLHEHRLYHKSLATLMTLVFAFTVFANTKIYLVVKKLSSSPNRPHDPAAVENTTKLKVFLREIRQAKSCFIVVICFAVFCFLPGAVTIPFLPILNQTERQAIIAWVYALGFLNSSINSIIFFWTKTMLRNEAVKTYVNIINLID